MFSKKKIYKSNLDIDFKADINEDEQDKQKQENIENEKKKKVKTNNLNEFSTNSITSEYKLAADNLTDDLKYKSKPELIGKTKDNAFAYNEIDTDINQDSKALALKNIKISQEIKLGKLDKKYYKGLNGYVEYNEKSDNAIRSSKYTGSLGPIRAPTHIRATCRFDYNPSLCKDWHDTGSCVFGDSCIYIHDRGDYKSGWELEKEWEEEQKKKGKNDGHLSDIEDDGDFSPLIQIPEICQICENKLNIPIITQCEHFFCEKCALNHYSKSKTCFICKKTVNGNFNDGQKVINKMKATRKEQIKAREGIKNNNKHQEHKEIDEAPEEMNDQEKDDCLVGIEIDGQEIENLEMIGNEFKRKRAKQKAQIRYESDWLL